MKEPQISALFIDVLNLFIYFLQLEEDMVYESKREEENSIQRLKLQAGRHFCEIIEFMNKWAAGFIRVLGLSVLPYINANNIYVTLRALTDLETQNNHDLCCEITFKTLGLNVVYFNLKL